MGSQRISSFINLLLTNKRLLLAVALAAAFFGLFLQLTFEMSEREEETLAAFDRNVLIYFASLRQKHLNGPAVDLTALGSFTVLTIFTIVGLLIFHLKNDRRAMLYLLLGSSGSALLSNLFKNLLARERPSVVPRLVEVTSYSYPSGHSLAASSFYLLIAFLSFQAFRSKRHRALIVGFALVLIFLIAFSRVYLGVHYPSDTLGGILLGAAWTFSLTAFFYGKK